MGFTRFGAMAALAGLLCIGSATAARDEVVPTPAASSVRQVTDGQTVLLDVPQRTFLVAEPIHVFVGLKNDTDAPAAVVVTKVSLEIRNPKGEFCMDTVIKCGASPTLIGARKTLWIPFDLSLYTGFDRPGKYTMTARVASSAVLRSETITVNLVETSDSDKMALDWIRSQVRSEAKRIESDSARAAQETLPIGYLLSGKSRTLAQAFPNSVLGKHAQYSLTEGKFSDAVAGIKVDKAAIESALLSYRSIADELPDSALAVLARIGESKCLLLLERTAEPARPQNGFAEQEIKRFAEGGRTRRSPVID